MSDPTIRSFFWNELAALIEARRGEDDLILSADGEILEATGIRIRLPPVLPLSQIRSEQELLAALPDALGLHLVVLLQAGAASLGLFEDGQSIETKTLKKYVVRGRGKSQTTYLKRKGKSRYGSRLRLQNARRLLIEINEKLESWLGLYGEPDRLFYSAPVRLWPELFADGLGAPLAKEDDWIRIRRDLPTPTTQVMLQAYRQLCRGQIEKTGE